MRHLFGGSPADFAMEKVGNQLLLRPAAVGTVWDAASGGTQITDLTDLTGTPITVVTADSDGAVSFYGPDGTASLFVDFGYGRRYALSAVDTGEILSDFLAQGGQPGGWAMLDGTGHIDASQIPARLDWLIVTNYGAKGDGAQDDTTFIQAAINACQPGGVVYFPRGVYKTTATLDLKNGVSLVGSHASMMLGPGMTETDYPCYIQPATPFTGTSVVQIIGDADGTHPAISGEQRIVNLMLDGSQLTGSSIDGLFAKGNVQNVVLDNVSIKAMPNNGIVTASRTDGTYPFSWRLHHVMIDRCHANGILFTGNTDVTLNDVQVIGCWAQGIVLTNCTNAQMVACRTEWNGSHGYRITGAWGNWQGSGGMQVTGCSTDRNGQHGMLIDATGNTPILVSGLMTRRDGRNGGTGGGSFAGLAIIGATVPVTVDGVTCYPGVDDGGTSTNSPQYGARLSGSTTITLDNAYLHGATVGLYDDGTNTAVSVGDGVVTLSGATTATTRRMRSRPGGDLGVYIPAGWGRFWQPKRDTATTGTARLVVVGDSVSQGYYASDLNNTNWVSLMRQSLQTQYGNGGSGFFTTSRSDLAIGADAAIVSAWETNKSLLTATGGWSLGGTGFGPGICWLTTTSAGTLTFQVRGSTIKMYSASGAAPRAPYTYSIDGGAPVTVTVATGGSTGVQVNTVTGLANTTHTIVISWAGTGTDPLFFYGVSGENTTGIIVDNMGRAGYKSSDVIANATLGAAWNGGTAYPADLVIYSMALNDANTAVTADTWLTNVATYLKEMRAAHNGATDLLLLLQHVGNFGSTAGYTLYSQYAARIRGLAEAYGAALVDMWSLGRNSWDYWNSLSYWGNATTAGGIAGTDSVHPSDAGHAYIASQVTPIVMG
jgi:lysophospholipase L1-like esterase